MEWFGTRNSSPDVVKRAGVRRRTAAVRRLSATVVLHSKCAPLQLDVVTLYTMNRNRRISEELTESQFKETDITLENQLF